jgi:hypothetical protein
MIKITYADPDECFLRQAALRALRGETVTLPPDEPSNLHSLALARTQRAIRLLRLGRFASGPTDPAA